MPKPRLNKKQRRWLNNFRSLYPWYKVREIRTDLDSDRIVVLKGTERLPLPLVPEFATAIAGYRLHTHEGQNAYVSDKAKFRRRASR